MKAIVEVRYEWPPHQVIADVNAWNVDRVLTRTGRGAFAFNALSSLDRGILQEGRIVVIHSTEDTLPYVGVITQIAEDAGSGAVEVSGDNYASVLYNLAIDQTAPVANRDAGKIAQKLLREAQGFGRSVFVQPGIMQGTPLTLQGSLDVGSQSLGEAFDSLAERVNDEWWLEHLVTRTKIDTYLYWGRRGVDNSGWLYLEEGRDFTKAEYKRDGLGAVRSVIAVGGGGPLAGRASVAVTQAPGALSANRTQAKTRAGVGQLIARDVYDLRARDTDPTVLADAANRAYERPTTAAESLSLTITSRQWALLNPGDTVTARFHSLGFGGLTRAVRIDAMQPDESTGECDLDVTV